MMSLSQNVCFYYDFVIFTWFSGESPTGIPANRFDILPPNNQGIMVLMASCQTRNLEGVESSVRYSPTFD